MDDKDWLADFLRNLEKTKSWLRKRHGDRMIDGRTLDDFAQEAALSVWRKGTEPRFMQRKAALQQKTFFKRRVYNKPKSVPMSSMERRDGEVIEANLSVSRPSEPQFMPTEDDWNRLKKRFQLRDIDIEMLQMRCRGIPVREIASLLGRTVNSIHVRISEIKMRIVATYDSEERFR